MKHKEEIPIKELLNELLEEYDCSMDHINWYSWPQVFSSTAGPRGGIGGQALTTFQVYAFELPNGDRRKYCAGIWKDWNGELFEFW